MKDSKQKHMEKVQNQFASQAKRFNKEGYSLSNKEYLQWALNNIPLSKNYCVLDVAAGTGILSRGLARRVKKVYAVDASSSMLEIGKRETEEARISNIVFEKGFAEDLPYDDNSFDLVACRLAFHHFYDIENPFNEMVRVAKPGGYIVIMDLISSEDEELANRYNKLETLRDNSHTYALTEREMIGLFNKDNIKMKKTLSMDVEMPTDDWLNLTKPSKRIRKIIKNALEDEVAGGKKTGMRPYIKNGDLYFLHRWMLVLAQKER